MKNIHEEILDNQDDDLGYTSTDNYVQVDPDDEDLVEEEDDDFDLETGDDIDDDVEDELVSSDTLPDEDEDWDEDDDLLGDEEEEDDLIASADDTEKSVTHDVSFNSDYAGRPQGRTSGRMTDHNPGTTGFTNSTG